MLPESHSRPRSPTGDTNVRLRSSDPKFIVELDVVNPYVALSGLGNPTHP